MNFDYLDEIKIEKKSQLPAVRGENSVQKQNKKEDLIKKLQSEFSEDETEVSLSLKDIEQYKKAMALEF